jgi:BirA family biotin operon repressor/biotin-[acetyl-CoA-carboxylase] ligase
MMDTPNSVVYVESNRMSQRKQTVIDILRESQGFVSGEAMSSTLGISRNAVHKHVKSLRSRGYRILGVSRRGYRLEGEPSRLSMGHITDRTAKSAFGRSYRYYDEIESTNVEAKSLAVSGAPEGTVVIAEAQSAGRGRLGRRWTSPAGKGLLFSVLLRPAMPMSEAHLFTLVAACAAADAIESLIDVPVQIKWPNDLFIAGRKVGGILLEVAGEQDEVDWLVVGIGINVNTEFSELPVALRRTACSLKMAADAPVDRSELLSRLLLALEAGYGQALAHGFEHALSGFRRRDFLLAHGVSIQTREGIVAGKAAGIDDRGALLVEVAQRQFRSFHSGDVTLRS